MNGLVSVTAADEDTATGNRFCTFALFIMWVMNKFKLIELDCLKLSKVFYILFFVKW